MEAGSPGEPKLCRRAWGGCSGNLEQSWFAPRPYLDPRSCSNHVPQQVEANRGACVAIGSHWQRPRNRGAVRSTGKAEQRCASRECQQASRTRGIIVAQGQPPPGTPRLPQIRACATVLQVSPLTLGMLPPHAAEGERGPVGRGVFAFRVGLHFGEIALGEIRAAFLGHLHRARVRPAELVTDH